MNDLLDINSHYVPRFLTSPWEFGQRKLYFFDFGSMRVDSKSSRSLLSKKRIYSKAVERFLGDWVETPFARFREHYLERSKSEVDDWKLYRAAMLMVILQGPRVGTAFGIDDTGLEGLVQRGETFIDQLVGTLVEQNQLATIPIKEDCQLFVPSSGYFVFPIQDVGCVSGWTWAYGVPVLPRLLLALMSKTVRPAEINAIRPAFLMGRSVGAGINSNRVVVPIDIAKCDRAGELADALVYWRKWSTDLNGQIMQMRSLVDKMHRSVGITLIKVPGCIGDRHVIGVD